MSSIRPRRANSSAGSPRSTSTRASPRVVAWVDRDWAASNASRTNTYTSRDRARQDASRGLPRPRRRPDRRTFDLLVSPEQVTTLPGAAAALAALRDAGYALVMVTNQRWWPAACARWPTWTSCTTSSTGASSETGGRCSTPATCCPHHPDADDPRYRKACDCRKPRPGMLVRAARELGLDLARSYMVGDRRSDIAAGAAAGCYHGPGAQRAARGPANRLPRAGRPRARARGQGGRRCGGRELDPRAGLVRALVLSAGYGTRLGSLTAELPKPMLDVGGLPLLEWILMTPRLPGHPGDRREPSFHARGDRSATSAPETGWGCGSRTRTRISCSGPPAPSGGSRSSFRQRTSSSCTTATWSPTRTSARWCASIAPIPGWSPTAGARARALQQRGRGRSRRARGALPGATHG